MQSPEGSARWRHHIKRGNAPWDISSFQRRDFGFTAAIWLTSGYISRSNTNIQLNIFEILAESERFIVRRAWKWAPVTSTNGPDAQPVIDGELGAERLRHCSGGTVKGRHWESAELETGSAEKLSFAAMFWKWLNTNRETAFSVSVSLFTC